MSLNPNTSQVEDTLISWNKQSILCVADSILEFEASYYGGIVLIPCKDHWHSQRLLLRLRGIVEQEDSIYEVALKATGEK